MYFIKGVKKLNNLDKWNIHISLLGIAYLHSIFSSFYDGNTGLKPLSTFENDPDKALY